MMIDDAIETLSEHDVTDIAAEIAAAIDSAESCETTEDVVANLDHAIDAATRLIKAAKAAKAAIKAAA